jgi:hypothetical protein
MTKFFPSISKYDKSFLKKNILGQRILSLSHFNVLRIKKKGCLYTRFLLKKLTKIGHISIVGSSRYSHVIEALLSFFSNFIMLHHKWQLATRGCSEIWLQYK